MKILKGLFVSVLILVFLIGTAVFILITFYKKDMAALLVEELRNKHQLLLTVEDVNVSFLDNWPHASVQLDNVIIESQINEGKSEPLIKAGKISLSFNLERMLHKEFLVKYVSIRDADIALVKNADGTKNFVFQKPSVDSGRKTQAVKPPVKDSSMVISFELSKVSFKNTRFRYVNRQREQNIEFLLTDVGVKMKHYSDGVKGRLKGDVFVEELLFQARRGPFLKKKTAKLDLDLCYFMEEKMLMAMPGSVVEISKQKYAPVVMVHVGHPKKLALIVNAPKIDYATASSLLPGKIQRVLSNFEVDKPVNAKITLLVNIGQREDPILLVDFSGDDIDLKIGNTKIPYSGVSFKGRLLSVDSTFQKGDAEHAKIVFSPIKGNIYQFPFTAAVKVVNLIDPKIFVDANLVVEGEKVDFKVAKDFILKGTTYAHVRYSGPTANLNTHEFLLPPMKLRADVKFKNLSYREVNRPYTYVVNGDAHLNNRDLTFEKLKVNTLVGDATLKGRAENFMNYILGYTNGFKAHLAVSSELIDLNHLFAAQLDTAKTEHSSTAEPVKKKKSKKRKKQEEVVQKAPEAPSRFEFNVQLFARKMYIKNVEAEFVNADMNYKNEELDIKALRLNTCDGKLSASGTISDFNKIRAVIDVENVNVTKLFEQFDNFNQTAILNDNLKGTLSLDAIFKTDLDSKMRIIGESMVGQVTLKLTDGHLINYEPVQSLSNVLFKNRDFNDVSFSEINEVFRLQGYKMEISELEIASNVLNLFVVDGLYDFQGISNINILIPWSNLKRRGKYYVPKSSGQTAENTKGVKLNFQGPGKKMKLTFGHKQLSPSM